MAQIWWWSLPLLATPRTVRCKKAGVLKCGIVIVNYLSINNDVLYELLSNNFLIISMNITPVMVIFWRVGGHWVCAPTSNRKSRCTVFEAWLYDWIYFLLKSWKSAGTLSPLPKLRKTINLTNWASASSLWLVCRTECGRHATLIYDGSTVQYS